MSSIHKIMHHPLVPIFLIDIISVCLFVIACALIGETILPGIIYRYVSPITLYGVLFILCTITITVVRTQNISFAPAKNKSLFTTLGFLFFIILTTIACIRYSTFLIGTTFFLTATLFWIAHKLYRDEIQKSS